MAPLVSRASTEFPSALDGDGMQLELAYAPVKASRDTGSVLLPWVSDADPSRPKWPASTLLDTKPKSGAVSLSILGLQGIAEVNGD